MFEIKVEKSWYDAIYARASVRTFTGEPTEEQLAKMAHDCAVTNHGKRGSAKVCYEQDFLNIYRMAL